jgi:iron complex transport system substrate-binding protein
MNSLFPRDKSRLTTLTFSLLLLCPALAHAKQEPALSAGERERLLVMGTAIGELVYAFGLGDSVVARDVSCEFPPEIESKPAIGYFRQVSAEGILSMRPTAILSTDAAGPPNVLEQLRKSGVALHLFSAKPEITQLHENIHRMGELLHAPERAEAIVAQLNADLAAIPERPDEPIPVLFLLSPPGSDRLLAAGAGTAAHTMIELAGAENAFPDLKGYRPVSSEVIAERRPAVILLPANDAAMSAEASAGHAVVDRLVASGETRLVRIDLAETLAFGPRTGQAAADLHRRIYE